MGWMLFLTPNQQCQSTKGILPFIKSNCISSILIWCQITKPLGMQAKPAYLVPVPSQDKLEALCQEAIWRKNDGDGSEGTNYSG